jgi:hypothetical protein
MNIIHFKNTIIVSTCLTIVRPEYQQIILIMSIISPKINPNYYIINGNKIFCILN